MSIYIHIPFCNKICSYCDFCKMLYYKKWVNSYLEELKKEIEKEYKQDTIKTLYIGGGTPSSLSIKELEILFKIINQIKLDNTYEFTFECNIDDLDEEKLKLLFKNKVNRLSIGVQTFNKNHLKILNRNHNYKEVAETINLAKTIGFNNINVDLIYAIPNQTIKELKEDLDLFTSLNIEHISTYSLMIEPHTRLYINKTEQIDEDLDYEMYNYIINYLKNKGFNHYEISNFAKKNKESKHNLTYWNNENYYGFGLGASGYINKTRYDNVKSLNKYLNGIYKLNEEILDKNKTIENELILGFRKMEGINIDAFNNKYNIDILSNKIIQKLIKERKLINENNYIYIKPEYIYISNDILVNFIGETYE
ncbi:MAG: radical SAM family heme chaperone HemW [Bacilli bacterium]|nr:radical SAM family heme chaperone HemW [Bacilli bacterium]